MVLSLYDGNTQSLRDLAAELIDRGGGRDRELLITMSAELGAPDVSGAD